MEDNQTHIWDKYQKGIEHHNSINLYAETERNNNFFIGDQWKGVNFAEKGYIPPVKNIIKPIVKLMYSTVAMQKRTVTFSDMTGNQEYKSATDLLNRLFEKEWERGKFDTKIWNLIKNAAIDNASYIYAYGNNKPRHSLDRILTPKFGYQIIRTTNIYFADEQNSNLSEQEYIIVSERLPVKKVKKIAKANGITQADIDLISSDNKTDRDIGSLQEVKTEDGKCTSLLYFEKTDEGIKFCKSVESVIYEKGILPIDVYPIVGFVWEEFIGTARGVSAVKHLVPNQLAINRTLYRLDQAIRQSSFPKLVYDEGAIQSVEKLSQVGATIGVRSLNNNPISSLITYLAPAPMSQDANNFQLDLITSTRELAGAGDAATGQVDPTKASGEAIKAARDQAALPLNEQVATQVQTIEDLALLIFKMQVGYSPNGLEVVSEDENGNGTAYFITQEQMSSIDPEIKVDVSPVDPYSIMATDNNLLSMLSNKHISFDEFVKALPINTSLPKTLLESIIKDREQLAALQAQQMAQMPQELDPSMTQGVNPNMPQNTEVMPNEMPVM